MQKKLLLVFILVILVAVLSTALVSMSFVKNNYMKSVESDLLSQASFLKELIDKDTNLNDLANLTSKNLGVRVTFIDYDGVVVGDSNADYKTMENHANRVEIKSAYNGDVGISTRYSNTIKIDMLYLAIPFESENQKLVIRLALPLYQIKEYDKLLLYQIIISILTGAILAFIISLSMSRSIVKPIIELTETSKRISNGEYGNKVYINRNDEIGKLAEHFNEMSIALESNIKKSNDRSLRLRSILNSMINPVIVVDNYRKIMFTNPESEKIFGFEENDIKGKYFLEVLRNNTLDIQIRNLIENNQSMVTEIEIMEPTYMILKVYSNPISYDSNLKDAFGVVMLFQDITEMRKLERMRKDFVANVSHELKTPLTSIKGFVETLLDGALDNKSISEKFLNIIDIETERLTAIIEDLLLLSDIETDRKITKSIEFNACSVTREVIDLLSNLAEKTNVDLIFNANEEDIFLYGNLGWFKQMLINIIDNGIKYNKESGTVEVSISRLDENVKIRIADTGVGISNDHINRLFERFYRVDKARTREVGGTGLGLAIVKHIVFSFNGKVNVKSIVGKGTEFNIIIPIKKG